MVLALPSVAKGALDAAGGLPPLNLSARSKAQSVLDIAPTMGGDFSVGSGPGPVQSANSALPVLALAAVAAIALTKR